MKRGLEKLEETELAWETHAKDDEFYGLTLAEFKAQVQLSRDARAEETAAKEKWQTARNKTADTDKVGLAMEKKIAKAIAGDERYGDDSSLYESTGRVRKSERKTGLTRRKETE